MNAAQRRALHVRQIEDLGCFIASAAMASGHDYRMVRSLIGNTYHPLLGVDDPSEALGRMGYRNGRDFINMARGPLSAEFFWSLLWGRKAIAFIPPGLWIDPDLASDEPASACGHFVYWGGEWLHDPLYRQPTRDLSDYPLEYALLFNHTL